MAKYKGTNGNDTITGSSGDDTIVPLLGQDDVDGGAGYDTLTVDYSSLSDSLSYSSFALGVDGAWSGFVTGGSADAPSFVTFKNIEQVKFTATQADDYLTVDLGTLIPDKSRLTLNGSGGDDTLSVLGGELGKRLTLDASGARVKSNFAALSGWDNYDIGLGLSAGNKLTLGGGDDSISSLGGKDTIDGGAGHDTWAGYYYHSTDADMNFFYTTATATATVTAAGTQLAEIKNVEQFTLETGDGDDEVTMYGGAGLFFGGAGTDEIALNPFGAGAAMRYDVYLANAATLAGQAAVLGGGDTITFSEYEEIVLGGSSDADQFVFNGGQFLMADAGFQVYLAGGEGDDSLNLELQAQGALALRAGSAGSGHIDGLAATNSVTWNGIETATVLMGAGDDTVAFNIASKTLFLNGNDGLDTIDFSSASAALSFDLAKTTAQVVDGVAIVASNVEGVIGSKYADFLLDSVSTDWIRGGDGADYVRSSADSTDGTDVFDGGAGIDVIDYINAASAVYVNLGLTTAQSTGGGGTDTLIGFETLVGSNFNDVLTGSSGNDTLTGASGNDILEGGAGDDTLYGNDGIDTARYAGAAAAVTVKLTLASQNTGGAGTDYLSSIENLVGSNYGDTLGGDANANRLTGGRGADNLTGLGGADVFVFTSKLDSQSSGYDTIADFSHAQGDKIDLSAIDAKDGIGDPIRTNDAFTWIGSDAFHGISGELREVAVRGGGYWLYGDTNGDKTADLVIFVNSGTPPLPNSDIVL